MRLYGSIHPKLLDFYLDFAFFYKRTNNEKTAKLYFYKSLASNEISDRVSDPIKYMRATAGLLFLDNKVDEKFVNRSIEILQKSIFAHHTCIIINSIANILIVLFRCRLCSHTPVYSRPRERN